MAVVAIQDSQYFYVWVWRARNRWMKIYEGCDPHRAEHEIRSAQRERWTDSSSHYQRVVDYLRLKPPEGTGERARWEAFPKEMGKTDCFYFWTDQSRIIGDKMIVRGRLYPSIEMALTGGCSEFLVFVHGVDPWGFSWDTDNLAPEQTLLAYVVHSFHRSCFEGIVAQHPEARRWLQRFMPDWPLRPRGGYSYGPIEIKTGAAHPGAIMQFERQVAGEWVPWEPPTATVHMRDPAPDAEIAREGLRAMSDADSLAWMGTDAQRWAEMFMAVIDRRPFERDFMLGWFANAIEAGRSAGHESANAEFREVMDLIDDPSIEGRGPPAPFEHVRVTEAAQQDLGWSAVKAAPGRELRPSPRQLVIRCQGEED